VVRAAVAVDRRVEPDAVAVAELGPADAGDAATPDDGAGRATWDEDVGVPRAGAIPHTSQ
jgi:hypothetical protein